MIIAANYSEHLLALLPSHPGVAVKVSDWRALDKVERVTREFPRAQCLVHLTLVLGSNTPVDRAPFFGELRRIVALARPSYLSAHIGFNCQVDYAPDGRWIFGPRLPDDALIENTRRNVELLRDAFGLDVILENQPNVYGGPSIPHFVLGCTTPAFIQRTLDATGCDFLLDLAHARVNAAFLGVPVEEHLAALPLDRARELHLSGCRVVNGLLADEHGELDEEDYALLGKALERCAPHALTLEYDADRAALARQIEHLCRL